MAEEKAQWEYKTDDASSGKTVKSAAQPVSWTASEYIEHQRGANWYGLLLIATIALAIIVYFFTKDYFAAGVIAVVGIIVGFGARQKPRQVTYTVDDSGFKADQKFYPYNLFKSFAIIREGQINSISFEPIKRFMPPVAAYFEGSQEGKILEVVGEHLPMEEREPDSIDRLTKRLRF